MNAQDTADIIDAIVRDHRRATRRVRSRLAAIDEEARGRSVTAAVAPPRAGVVLRSPKDAVVGDDAQPDEPRSNERQRPARWLS